MITGSLGSLYGINIFADERLLIEKQFRFPKSKKKRIRKKWSKIKSNWKTSPDPSFYSSPFGFVCHPACYDLLKKEITNYYRKQETKLLTPAEFNEQYLNQFGGIINLNTF